MKSSEVSKQRASESAKAGGNPALRRLGFDANDRVVVIHADDIGMCHATLPAFADLMDFGLVSSGALMVTCPWFPEAAALCQTHPAWDVGIHLTLNSEWSAYRWRPLSDSAGAASLLDETGYLPRTVPALLATVETQAAVAEIKAQIEHARRAGVNPSHADSHMFALLHEQFFPLYAQICLEARLLPFIPRHDFRQWAGRDALIDGWEKQGVPIFDQLIAIKDRHEPGERVAEAKKVFDGLSPGLTCFLVHPAQDTPELRALAPRWQYRVADYEAFMSAELAAHVRDSGIQVISYHTLRANMPFAP